MTILQTQGVLLRYFNKFTSYREALDFTKLDIQSEVGDQYIELMNDADSKERLQRTIIIALDAFVDNKLVTRSEDKTFYVLAKPLQSLQQTVTVSGQLAGRITFLSSILAPTVPTSSLDVRADNLEVVVKFAEACVNDLKNPPLPSKGKYSDN